MTLVFNSSNGIISGDAVVKAFNKVADNLIESGNRIREEDHFALHVTNKEKEEYIRKYHTDIANEVRQGRISSFTVWQRINTELTDDCIALLP